jgi:pimeloyl-ACP methyl ester carboxylesterase
MLRALLSVLGLIFSIPVLILIVLLFWLPISASGVGYLFGASLIAAGLILAPRMSHYYLLVGSGIVLVVIVVSVRISLVNRDSGSGLEVIALPEARSSSWVNALIDEQDSLVFGEALFHQIGGSSDREHEGLTSAFKTAYSEMRKGGSYSSPVLSTYLGLQRAEHFDVVVIEPEQQPEFAVVFLHGYMGNVTAQCWEIAQAVKKVGGVTLCPSTVWTGEWWQPKGQAILREIFNYVHTRGIQRFYVGGFSNGGFSISRLAPEWNDEEGLSGLFFIDGFANGTSIRAMGLPVLVIEGAQDERVPVAAARQFALGVGDVGTYAEIEGDHFLIMKHPDLVQQEIASWLEKQEAGK